VFLPRDRSRTHQPVTGLPEGMGNMLVGVLLIQFQILNGPQPWVRRRTLETTPSSRHGELDHMTENCRTTALAGSAVIQLLKNIWVVVSDQLGRAPEVSERMSRGKVHGCSRLEIAALRP